MVKGMASNDSLKKLNPNSIDITKVPTLLAQDEIAYQQIFYKKVYKNKKEEGVDLKGWCHWQI
jgi:hypothetical protein